ncbi:Txe/YoeB family addiction module toxin [Paracoccus sp. MKU1]|uniref:Txe/YoeB family addiction module toxin n=1 Tax=Paracoccus sp. MKU1 TaxID=1745182 RepID=UPI0007193B6D|nr:Txe/YoeB family addiction module toxin [Paracoccus sp. MKU1]KRW94289.1 hypothetical protein AQY21_20380 [Paracoccus sp. MKU1]
MNILFDRSAWDDYLWWQEQPQTNTLERINELIEATRRQPFKGIGKPEPLRGNLSGYWSRRIDGEHRFVYKVAGKGDDQVLRIASLRYHY